MRGNDYQTYLMLLCGFAGSAMLLLLAARAAGLITQEKERDTWLAILATPLTGREILLGKLVGNLYSIRWVTIILLFAWGLACLLSGQYILPALVFAVMFLVLSVYASLLGLLFSLRSPSSLRAIGSTLFVLIFLGGGYLFFCCICLFGGAGRNETGIFLAPCIPYLLAFPAWLNDVLQNTYAHNRDFLPAFTLGVLGYAGATACIYAYLVTNFEKISGRCGDAPEAESSAVAAKPRVG